MVADAVDEHGLAHAGAFGHVAGDGGDGAGVDHAVVAALLVVADEDAGAVGGLPPEGLGDGLLPGAGAVEVEVLDAAAVEVGRHGRGVAEGVGAPVELDGAAGDGVGEEHVEEAAGVEDVAGEGLAAGEVLVALDPVAGGDLPATLADARLDAVEQVGAVLGDKRVDARLALGEVEGGELVEQVEDGGEGVAGGGDSLRPGPHPVHVDVGVSDEADAVALGLAGEEGEGGLDGAADFGGVGAGFGALGGEAADVLDGQRPFGGGVGALREEFGEVDLGLDAQPEKILAGAGEGELALDGGEVHGVPWDGVGMVPTRPVRPFRES